MNNNNDDNEPSIHIKVTEDDPKKENTKVSKDALEKGDIDKPEEIKSSATKNSIYIVGGEKGGVGKSFFTRCMLDYFVNRGWKDNFTLIEADPTIDDVSPIYSEDCDKIVFDNNKFAHGEPNKIIEEAQSKTVVVNLPSNVYIPFNSWVERSMFLSSEIQEYFGQTVYFFVSDGCYHSIRRFTKQMELYGNKELSHCLILNPGRLSCGANFSYINKEYPELFDILKKYKVPVIQLPELLASLQFKCDRDSLSYRELAEGLHIRDKGNALRFLKSIDAVFNSIFPEDIANPSGLSKITKTQMKDYKKGKLPFETMAELFAS